MPPKVCFVSCLGAWCRLVIGVVPVSGVVVLVSSFVSLLGVAPSVLVLGDI